MAPEVLARKLSFVILAHLYERIDYALLQESIAPALRDFDDFLTQIESRLKDTI